MRLYFIFGLLITRSFTSYGNFLTSEDECPLPEEYIKEIDIYRPIINQIFSYVLNGQEKNQTYDALATFVDKFGNRVTGTQNLEDAIDYMVQTFTDQKFDNVHTEEAQVPHWVRGKEYAELITPRKQNLAMLGLGGSVATPKEGITAQAIVVNSFDDLKSKAKLIPGKIVVYNQEWVSYSISVAYRKAGASEAAKLGAIATLIRSITPFSINSPHTGWQDYAEGVTKIPTACITVEDAEMLNRMFLRGDEITIKLFMDAETLPLFTSRNTIAELTGSKHPEQIVVVGGHIDSWDVGDGAMDDGGGAFISWKALALLQTLNLIPRRTLRVVLWTGEEQGLFGGEAYFKAHEAEKDNFNLLMESDFGTFDPLGLTFSGTNKTAQCIVRHVLNLFEPLGISKMELTKEGPDIIIWQDNGVPGSSLMNRNEKYFYFHHTEGDRLTVIDPNSLALCTAFWAASSFIFSDLSFTIPKDYS